MKLQPEEEPGGRLANNIRETSGERSTRMVQVACANEQKTLSPSSTKQRRHSTTTMPVIAHLIQMTSQVGCDTTEERRDIKRKSSTARRNSISQERKYSSSDINEAKSQKCDVKAKRKISAGGLLTKSELRLETPEMKGKSASIRDLNTTSDQCADCDIARKKSHVIDVACVTDSLLCYAFVENNVKLTNSLLQRRASGLNELTQGSSLLHQAAMAGSQDCLELLLRKGSNVNLKDARNRTALEYAVLAGHFECASLLITYGADTQVIRDGLAL